jgi:hypothetical protein
MGWETDYSDLDELCDRIERNDPTLVGETCNIPIFRPQYLRSLVFYLPKCTVITSLSFDVTPYCRARFDIKPMLKYLSETKLIQRVTLTRADDYSRPPCAFTAFQLIQVVANNAEIALVEFSSRLPLHPRGSDLLTLIQNKASSLTHLTLKGFTTYDGGPWADADVKSFADAVGCLTLLQSLVLSDFPNPELTALTLQQLRSHACLRKLAIVGYEPRGRGRYSETVYSPAIVEDVSLMLQSGAPLEILELKRVSMFGSAMEHLLSGLKACPSLTELSLDGVFEREAATSLVRCLRANGTSAVCGIRQLCLANGSRWTFPFTLLLTSLTQRACTSTSSSLQCLKLLNHFDDLRKLLRALVKGHRLSILSLGYLSDHSWSQLNVQLPNLVYLNEITVEYLLQQGHSDSMAFVRAMRKNGCLHKVSEITAFDDQRSSRPIYLQRATPLFAPAELQRIRGYCERNQATRELLQNPDLCDGDEAKTPISLFPKLFEVMKPARRMAPNFVFMGLLACDSHDKSIGPRGRDKRLLVSS